MRRLTRAVSVGLALLLLGAVVGCRIPRESPRSRYWVLATLGTEVAEAPIARGVGVGPIALPSYLDRAEIVTRATPNRLQVAPFDLWGQPLAEAFEQVLSRNLEALVPGTLAAPLSWRTSRLGLTHRVTVQVTRFEGDAAGNVCLDAVWTLEGRGQETPPIATGRVEIREPVSESGIEPIVAAMSRALGQLSQRVAEPLRALAAP